MCCSETGTWRLGIDGKGEGYEYLRWTGCLSPRLPPLFDPMSVRGKLAVGAVAVAMVALLIWTFAREIPYRVELGRRHHQIGQLWSFCIFYYCPRHGGHFPHDLEELRQLPEYKASSEYWDRALSEIELTAPGADRNDPGDGDVIVFREKKPDERGIRAFHEVGGAYGFT